LADLPGTAGPHAVLVGRAGAAGRSRHLFFPVCHAPFPVIRCVSNMTVNPKNEAGDAILARHRLLRATRDFFYGRGYIEVETANLARTAPTDPYIEPLRTFVGGAGPFYLHTSPEMGMKKVLVSGLDRIFQICKVFRVEEFEEHHSAEFTMLEWYGPGTYEDAMAETEALVRFLDIAVNGGMGASYTDTRWKTYRLAALCLELTGIDPLPLSREDLSERMKARGFEGLGADDTWEDLFFKLLIQEIEPPMLSREKGPYFIKDWPASLTAMAKKKDSSTVERFELYMRGLEIANGYSELLDSGEQRLRMIRDNEERLKLGKAPFAIDEAFLDAVGRISGPVAGVSIGIDRLLMALLDKKTIREVLPDRLTLRTP
jgi:lysyl-tRNA synthetase class 2